MKLMKSTSSRALLTIAALAVVAIPAVGSSHREAVQDAVQATNRGTVVTFPWVFEEGNETSRTMAVTTVEEVARRANYAPVSSEAAMAAWTESALAPPTYRHLPSQSDLRRFGQSVHADKVLYGSVSWHTRSIWVNLGPKTISTATVSVYVMDVHSGTLTYRRTGVAGRSDEKTNGLKVAGAVLFTPLVTAVSGGPSTPQEQRAVQIALAKAYAPWVKQANDWHMRIDSKR